MLPCYRFLFTLPLRVFSLNVRKLWPQNAVGAVSDTVMGGTMMETALFTDQDIVVFVIIASAVALVLSVLGLTTPDRTRSDIAHQLPGR